MMKRPFPTLRLVVLSAITSILWTAACSKSHEKSTEPTSKKAFNPTVPTSKQSFTQAMDISIDGKAISMQPDRLADGVIVGSSFVQGYGYFMLSVSNQEEDFSFSIATKIKKLEAGTYEVYRCLNDSDCTDDTQQVATLAPFPNGKMPALLDVKAAYKSSTLGLQPLTFIITQVEDAVWPGVPGTVKRVKGTFKASMASIDRNKDSQNQIAGPLKEVEGKFDLFCRVQ